MLLHATKGAKRSCSFYHYVIFDFSIVETCHNNRCGAFNLCTQQTATTHEASGQQGLVKPYLKGLVGLVESNQTSCASTSQAYLIINKPSHHGPLDDQLPPIL